MGGGRRARIKIRKGKREENETKKKKNILVPFLSFFSSTSSFFFLETISIGFIVAPRLVRFRRYEFADNVARYSFLPEIRRNTHEKKKEVKNARKRGKKKRKENDHRRHL